MATFIEDSKGDNKLVAPSIEEVDEDPEELRNLRGEGRYFGANEANDDESDANVIKAPEPKCSNCSEKGHMKRDCPHVICSYCGIMDDHYSQQCPTTMRCALCNESGHYRMHCPNKWKKLNCTICNSPKHNRDRCPSVWRVYLLKNDDGMSKKNLPMHLIYCYNCGEKGHYGDECDKNRSSRVPNDDGSAFSGKNLTSELRSQYFYNLKKQRSVEEENPSVYDNLRSMPNRQMAQPIITQNVYGSRFSNKRMETTQGPQAAFGVPEFKGENSTHNAKRKFKNSFYDDEDDEDDADEIIRYEDHGRSIRQKRNPYTSMSRKRDSNDKRKHQMGNFYPSPYQHQPQNTYYPPAPQMNYQPIMQPSTVVPTRSGMNFAQSPMLNNQFTQQLYGNPQVPFTTPTPQTYPVGNTNGYIPLNPAVKPARSGTIERRK
ncbi:zinc finger protein [Nakaseomyces bracarensis]|uniref:Zinc finger protein n=1 Tax=Nakaseomyces bracarensis TaxID=273131 RepID=A0ABR4NW11_9SACH